MAVFLHAASALPLALVALSQMPCTTAIVEHLSEESTKGHPIVRRQGHVSVDASGEFIQEEPLDRQHQHQRHHERRHGKALSREMCGLAFAYGQADKNNCSADDHHLIFTKSVCREAAAEAGLEIKNHSFAIDSDDFDKFPAGCFKDLCCAPDAVGCTENPNGCAFYNGDGSWPESPSGYAICTSPRYTNGTADTNDCPSGHEVITDLDNCSIAADCNGYCETGDFEIGLQNSTERMHHPKGCFIDTTGKDGPAPCVYWNPGPTGDTAPTNPVGIPLCKAPNSVTTPGSTTPAS